MKQIDDNQKLVRLTSLDDGRELLRFRRLDDKVWVRYGVEFIGLSETEWAFIDSEMDPRDVRMQFELSDGQKFHFAGVFSGYDAEKRQFRVRYFRDFPDVPTRWENFIRKIRGLPQPPPVSPERSPFFRSHGKISQRQTVKEYKSGNLGAKIHAIEDATSCLSTDSVPWLVPLLLDAFKSSDEALRWTACSGFAELARVVGYSEKSITEALVKRSKEENNPHFRKVVARTLATIARFTSASTSG